MGVSERELMTARIYDNFVKYGLMNGPCVTWPELAKSRSGKPIRKFDFSMSRIMDGTVEVYGKTFIRIKWQMGTPHIRSEVLSSEQEVYDWLKNRGWVGYGSSYNGGDNGGSYWSGGEESE